MADISLAVQPRHETGTRPSRRLRAAGGVPAVVYGHGIEPQAVTVDARELRSALASSGGHSPLRLRLGDTEHLVIARELQRHPVRRTLLHVDFQVVSREELVPAEVPVAVVGDVGAAAHGGGTVEQELHVLHVRARVDEVPAVVEADVAGLGPGDVLRVRDLRLPPGVVAETDPDTPVVTVHVPRGAEEAVPGSGGGGDGER
jgi:large subunit ribosomal protein L25